MRKRHSVPLAARILTFIGAWAIACALLISCADAQPTGNSTGLVVTTCGSLTGGGVNAYVAGTNRSITLDTNGNMCTPTSGGGTSNVNVTQWASVNLGAPSNYGTSPGAVAVPGVNAFITNAPVLGAGSALIGKVGIDQTTPGTTNGVQVNAALPAGTNSIGGVTFPLNVTPTNCSGTITSGGTAQNAFTAQTTLHGFVIANIDSTAGSGEPVWFSLTTTAAAATAGSYPLSAPTATTFAGLSSFSAPPGFGTNAALSVIATTTGHKFSCTWW